MPRRNLTLPSLPKLDVSGFPHFLESLAVTLACCLLQSLALLGLRLDSWMHELANFLRHYEAASTVARLPVNFVIAILFSLNLIVVCIARRRAREVADA